MGLVATLLLVSLLVAVVVSCWVLPLGSGRAVGLGAAVCSCILCAVLLVVGCWAGSALLVACGPLWWPALNIGWVVSCLACHGMRVEATMWWLSAALGIRAAAGQLLGVCRRLRGAVAQHLRSHLHTRIPLRSALRLPLCTSAITALSYLLPPIPFPSMPLPSPVAMLTIVANLSPTAIATLVFAIPLLAHFLSLAFPLVRHHLLRRYWLLVLHVTVQHLRCRVLFRQAVHWFMRPYLPTYCRESRNELIQRLHTCGIYLKSSTRKHLIFTPRSATLPIRRQPPSPTSSHLRLLFTAAILLSSATMAAAGGVGLTGVAAAMSSAGASQLASANLQHLALLDPGMAFQRMCRASSTGGLPQPPEPMFPEACAAVDAYQPDGVTAPDPAAATYWKDPENEWVIGNHPGLSQFQREQLQQMLLGCRTDCFAYSLSDLTGYTGAKFIIELKHGMPIIQRPRQHALLELAIQDEKCVEMFRAGIIRHADIDTQYASNATMPAKKDADGNWTDFRFCIDFRDINEATVCDHYGMHLAEDLFQAVGASCFFSKIDLRGAFHQILLDPASQAASSFYWRNQLFCFTRMPFGLKNASAFCQRVMDLEIGKAGLRDCCVCFVDDLLVHSKTAEEHLQHVGDVLDMLASCGLKAHPAKSLFCCESVEYLGHNISAKGLTPHEAKVAAVKGLRVPTNVSELKSVLGFLNYYRCYVPRFSDIAAPLNALMGAGVAWQWTQEHQAAYQQIKDIMCREGAALKQYDPAREVVVYADWSQHGIAAVLAQRDELGQEYMVACASRSLNKHERNYCSYEGEALAGVWAAKTFRKYLFGRHFTIVTDHQPLKWLMQSPDLTGKHMRWALSMQEFDCTIEHRAGTAHQNVDVPSRFPLPSSFDPTGACMDPELPSNNAAAAAAVAPAGARPVPVAAYASSASHVCHNPACGCSDHCLLCGCCRACHGASHV